MTSGEIVFELATEGVVGSGLDGSLGDGCRKVRCRWCGVVVTAPAPTLDMHALPHDDGCVVAAAIDLIDRGES